MVTGFDQTTTVLSIPIAAITVENPRERSEKTFRELVESIEKVGLKKPITVSRAVEGGEDQYRLVCGQGRMEAFSALGQTHIHAIVIEADEEERLLRSVIENIARRQHRPLEVRHPLADQFVSRQASSTSLCTQSVGAGRACTWRARPLPQPSGTVPRVPRVPRVPLPGTSVPTVAGTV